MVRTLSFHLSNMGSNPVNLVLYKYQYLLDYGFNSLGLGFFFRFVSFFKVNKTPFKKSLYFRQNLIYLKFSYLFFIITTQLFKKVFKLSYDTSEVFFNKIVVLRKQTNVLTVVKAPMAHKKFSKEQFYSKFYIVLLSVYSNNIEFINFKSHYSLFFIVFFFLSLGFYPKL